MDSTSTAHWRQWSEAMRECKQLCVIGRRIECVFDDPLLMYEYDRARKDAQIQRRLALNNRRNGLALTG